MKITELTQDQLEFLADNCPGWMADNCPGWMANNRLSWMANHRPDWMTFNRPGWMADNRLTDVPQEILDELKKWRNRNENNRTNAGST